MDFRRDFFQGSLSRLQFRADRFPVNLGKPRFEAGLAVGNYSGRN
jgi:hypothetical protein